MESKMETRIVKIEKGCFCIEYRKWGFSWYPWITVNKTFKTKTKAEEYIIKHFGNGKQDKN